MPLKAGQLRHRIVIESEVIGRNAQSNEPESDWKPFATVFAKIEPAAGSEVFNSQQVQGNVTHKITIRGRQGITNQMRVKYGARVFGIVAVRDVDERRIALELQCEERTYAR